MSIPYNPGVNAVPAQPANWVPVSTYVYSASDAKAGMATKILLDKDLPDEKKLDLLKYLFNATT